MPVKRVQDQATLPVPALPPAGLLPAGGRLPCGEHVVGAADAAGGGVAQEARPCTPAPGSRVRGPP